MMRRSGHLAYGVGAQPGDRAPERQVAAVAQPGARHRPVLRRQIGPGAAGIAHRALEHGEREKAVRRQVVKTVRRLEDRDLVQGWSGASVYPRVWPGP
jgi:hypothetical protein